MERIVSNPGVLRGKPVVRGTRISVELILELLAGGASIDELLESYPHLARADVLAALQYALQTFRHEEILPA